MGTRPSPSGQDSPGAGKVKWTTGGRSTGNNGCTIGWPRQFLQNLCYNLKWNEAAAAAAICISCIGLRFHTFYFTREYPCFHGRTIDGSWALIFAEFPRRGEKFKTEVQSFFHRFNWVATGSCICRAQLKVRQEKAKDKQKPVAAQGRLLGGGGERMSASDSPSSRCLLTFRGMEKIKLKCKLGIPEESGLQHPTPWVLAKSDKLL